MLVNRNFEMEGCGSFSEHLKGRTVLTTACYEEKHEERA
jgi:hypothetical protein